MISLFSPEFVEAAAKEAERLKTAAAALGTFVGANGASGTTGNGNGGNGHSATATAKRKRVRNRTSKPAAATTATRPAITPKQLASRKLQGQYMGLLRQANKREKSQAKKLAREQGREAAIQYLAGAE